MNKTKICSSCGKRKTLSNFNKSITSSDGTRDYCSHCGTLKMRNYRKTGKTTTNEFDSISVKKLEATVFLLNKAYEKYGYKITKTKI